MEPQYLFNLDPPQAGEEIPGKVRPNVWLLSSEEVPPILFTPDRISHLLGLSRSRVYELLHRGDLRSVKVGSSRRVTARALSDYVAGLEDGS